MELFVVLFSGLLFGGIWLFLEATCAPSRTVRAPRWGFWHRFRVGSRKAPNPIHTASVYVPARSNGVSRRVARRVLHLTSHPGSALSRPGVGTLTRALLEVNSLLEKLETISALVAPVESEGTSWAKLERACSRKNSSLVDRKVLERSKRRAARRQKIAAARQWRSGLDLHKRIETEALAAAEAKARSLFGEVDNRSTEEWAEELNDVWEGIKPSPRRRRPNPRLVEGSPAFLRAGRNRAKARKFLETVNADFRSAAAVGVSAAQVAEALNGAFETALNRAGLNAPPSSPRERIIRSGLVRPGTVENSEDQKSSGQVRSDVQAHYAWALDPSGLLGNVIVAEHNQAAVAQ